jgi:hypothetical protein
MKFTFFLRNCLQFCLLLSIFLLISCKKNKETEIEKKLKKEIATYMKLDFDLIQKVFHTSELESFDRSIRDKCKLLDIAIRSFYSIDESNKFSFLSVKEIKLDLIGEYKDINSFVKFLKDKSKYVGIKELIIDSQQTGLHNAKISIEILVKNYLDRDFLPAAISTLAGLDNETESILNASVKVYKSRYILVHRLLTMEKINWTNKITCLSKIPEKSYINRLQYLRTNHEEQLKLDVIAENSHENIKKLNDFFDTSLELKSELKTYSKRDKPEELSSGLVGLSFIYQK